MNRAWLSVAMVVGCSLAARGESPGWDRVDVYPSHFRLDGVRSEIHLVVTGYTSDGSARDLSRVARFDVLDPKVFKVEAGVIRGLADGRSEVVVKVDGLEARSEVEVTGSGRPAPVLISRRGDRRLDQAGVQLGRLPRLAERERGLFALDDGV